MAKKKFAIRSLFTARPTRSAAAETPADYPSDSDDLNDAHPFDPSQVNRPPKLDERTEIELRKACARIVENLKPSGHDLEDTRMQSDILVDNPDINPVRAIHPQKTSAPPPQPDATWYLDESGRSSQFVNPRHVVKSSDKRGSSTYRISGIASDYPPSDRVSKVVDAQDTSDGRHIDNPESPRAPPASAAVLSRKVPSPLPKQVNNLRPVHDQPTASSNFMSNNSAAPENGNPLASSDPTSTNGTASNTTSKRTSDRLTAGRQIPSLPPTRDSNISDDTGNQDSTYGEAQAVPIQHRYGHIVTSGQDRAKATANRPPENPLITSGTLSGPFEQPQFTGAVTSPTSESNKSPILANSIENPRTALGRQDSGKLASDYQKFYTQEQKAVTPTTQDHMSTLAKAPASKNSPHLVLNSLNRPASTSSQKSDGSRRASKALSPTSPLSPSFPKSSQTFPVPSKSAQPDGQIPQIPPLPDKHQYDESILVQDFYQPPGIQKMKHYHRPDLPQNPGDVEAADFDSFMSVVKHSSRPNTAASKGDATGKAVSTNATSSKTPDNTSSSAVSRPTSAAAEPVLSMKDPEGPTSNAGLSRDTANNTEIRDFTGPKIQSDRLLTPDSKAKSLAHQATQGPQAKEITVLEDQQQPVITPPIVSPHPLQNASPAIVSSSRTSFSTSLPVSSHSRSASTSKHPPRGLKRFLSKISSNERPTPYVNGYVPSRRKYVEGYAPGAYVPGYGVNGGIEENDEWFDEQACAAPVVGFGRGW